MENLEMDFKRILGVTFFHSLVLTQSLCEKDTIYLTCRLPRAGPRRASQLEQVCCKKQQKKFLDRCCFAE